jgi:lipopolysaccharide transport system ATP-binding protein
MNARLSFSVAAHLNPTVFLVDEVLAVGDIDFQRKCVNHMLRYLAGGGALILVSHSPYLIQSVCNRGIFIHAGRVQYAGSAIDALNIYLKNPVVRPAVTNGSAATSDLAAAAPALQRSLREISEARPVAIDEVIIEAPSGEALSTGEEASLIIKLRSLGEREICWGFTICTNDQWVCITGSADFTPRKITDGAHTLRCSVPKLPLLPGTYMLKIGIMEAASRQPLALFGWEDAPLAFQVQASASFLNNALQSINQLVTMDVKWDN